LLLPLIVLLLVGIPGNINTFNKEQRQDRPLGAYRHLISSLAHDPLARQAPPTIRPEPVLAPYVTIGWLVASAGRIPEPGRVKPSEAESNAFRLSFMQQKTSRAAGDCPTPVELPTTVTLARGDAIDLREGPSTFPGASDSMHLAPATHGLFGPALTFAAREGNDVVVLRDVGSVRITSASPFFAPRVCVITP
jgi:hypothetical protein